MSKFSKKFLGKSPFKSIAGHLIKVAIAYKAAPHVANMAVDAFKPAPPAGKVVLGATGAIAAGRVIKSLATPGKALLGAATSPIGAIALAHGAYKLGKNLNKKRKQKKARKELEKEQEQKNNNNDV